MFITSEPQEHSTETPQHKGIRIKHPHLTESEKETLKRESARVRSWGMLLVSRALSLAFNPFYYAISGLIVLFSFTYLSLLPISYKLILLGMAYIFTILLPTLLIRLYRHYQGWSIMHLFTQEGRMIPYVISIACYFLCFYVMNMLHVSHIITSVIVTALFIQIICAIINVWWKISTHTAAIGGITGGLLAFSEIFTFNPLWWLCVLLIIAGAVGSGRMILRQHNLSQVVGGYLVGTVTAFCVVIMI